MVLHSTSLTSAVQTFGGSQAPTSPVTFEVPPVTGDQAACTAFRRGGQSLGNRNLNSADSEVPIHVCNKHETSSVPGGGVYLHFFSFVVFECILYCIILSNMI